MNIVIADIEYLRQSARKDDIVKFIFKSNNNTGRIVIFPTLRVLDKVSANQLVTQSSFEDPCSTLTGVHGLLVGFDSGFQAINASHPVDKVVSFKVPTTQPLWFYSRQTGHCEQGMVFAINAPSKGDHSFEAFQNKANTTEKPQEDYCTWWDCRKRG